MNAVSKSRARSMASLIGSSYLLLTAVAGPQVASAHDGVNQESAAHTVKVSLSEWKVELTPSTIPPGPVVLEVKNTGTIPHAFEVEGGTLEQRTPQIQPGATTTLKLDLRAGSYEAYCPIGKGSHKMLGMVNHLKVGSGKHTAAVHADHDDDEKQAAGHEMTMGHEMAMGDDEKEGEEYGAKAKRITLTGGGPVIQILPGPFPFADSAAAVIRMRPADQQADLNHKAQMGPYSNNVAAISGDISLIAIDRGATGDSVQGTAQFTAQDGARWKVVMDRVQTKDIPFNPRFGGVIMGLFYHGASGVHTPLVPTIQSTVALWAFAHLYKNDQLVTDNAMVHIMLLSRTRRASDWALDCWDCSDRPVEELQLQVTPAPNTAPFDAPGGFLFVNWEKSAGLRASF
jgi:hypothetical protein